MNVCSSINLSLNLSLSLMSFPPPPGPSQSLLSPTPDSPPTDQTHFGRGKSSNLYLIAFLAILFLLLFISGCIVLRSYMLRRRYQRRLEEALGPGQLLAPRAQGSKIIKRMGLPKIINTLLTAGGDKWDQMMPISAQPVLVKRKIRVKQDAPTNTPDATAPPTRMMNLFARFRRSPLPNSNIIDGKHPSPSTQTNYRIRVEMLQLTVFIAMPSPSKSPRKNYISENTDPDPDEEESNNELPDIVFGVTRVNYRQSKSTPSPTLTPLQSP